MIWHEYQHWLRKYNLKFNPSQFTTMCNVSIKKPYNDNNNNNSNIIELRIKLQFRWLANERTNEQVVRYTHGLSCITVLNFFSKSHTHTDTPTHLYTFLVTTTITTLTSKWGYQERQQKKNGKFTSIQLGISEPASELANKWKDDVKKPHAYIYVHVVVKQWVG